MLKKIIILEIIAGIIVGIFVYRFYNDYQQAFEANQASKERLIEVRLDQARIKKETDDLNNELSLLRDSVDMKTLEIWKRRVQQLQEELE